MIDRQVALLQKRLERAEATIKRITQIETKPRLIIPSGAGSKIFFEVDSAVIAGTSSPYNGLMILTVTVKRAPCDQSSLLGTSVEVVDPSVCLANAETTAAVVGREGWAFRGIGHSLKVGDPANTLTPCHWVLDGLCCP